MIYFSFWRPIKPLIHRLSCGGLPLSFYLHLWCLGTHLVSEEHFFRPLSSLWNFRTFLVRSTILFLYGCFLIFFVFFIIICYQKIVTAFLLITVYVFAFAGIPSSIKTIKSKIYCSFLKLLLNQRFLLFNRTSCFVIFKTVIFWCKLSFLRVWILLLNAFGLIVLMDIKNNRYYFGLQKNQIIIHLHG